MPAISRFARSLAFIALIATPQRGAELQAPIAPVAAKKPHVTKIHGDTLVDDYFWLRDKKNPEVLAYLEAENAYAEAMMKGTEALQQKVYDELLSHVKQTELELPVRRGDYDYYERTETGKQYPIYARKKAGADAPEEVILDFNSLAKGFEYIGLGAYGVSNDGNLLAYAIDTTGNAHYTLFFKDLRTGELLPDKFDLVDSFVWGSDNKTIFYVTDDTVTLRPDTAYRHILGTATSDLLFREPDEKYRLEVSRTRDRSIVLLDSYSKTTNETRYLRVDDPAATLRIISPRREGHRYFVEHRDDRFYIRTNDRARNYRLVTVEDTNPSIDHWKEIVPARDRVELFEVNVFKNYIALSEVQDGNRTIRIVDRSGVSTPITFNEAVYNLSRDVNPEFNTTKFRYRYNSLLSPEAIYEFDMETHVNTLLQRTEVPNYDASLYASERVYAIASDGARIPLSIVYRKPLVRDGKRPMLLYGYGSYGIPLWPFFVRAQLPLLDRGVIYAVANVRGGGGMGQQWRDAGTMMHKRNTFTDFIAAAEHLVKARYTSSDRLVVTGHSAGGLLMGAAVTMRPKLFKAVVATSPFVDILNTMLDSSLPLTTNEYIEWGNPNIQKEYEYIKSYSPYDNIAARSYPAMLVQVSLNDTQVGYWEGAKFVAKMRAMKTDSHPLLLRVLGGGHAGSSGRYDAMRELAFIETFELTQMGISH